jgi:CHAD domain-containing protein
VHQARVATRRLREALPLLPDGKRRRKLERAARRLTRLLGTVRELDVALEMLEEVGREAGVPRAAVACLRQMIAEERRRLHAEAVRRMEDIDPARMRRRMVAAVRKSAAGGHSERAWRHAAARHRAVRRAARLKGAIDNAAGLYLPDRLHEVRIAIKKLRYALEIVGQIGARGTGRSQLAGHILALKRAQDMLGRMHDFEVLIARTRAVQASAAAPDLRLSGELDQLVRRFETECRLLHGHYMASRLRLLDICTTLTARPRRAIKRPAA